MLVGLVFGIVNGGLNLDIQFEGGTHLEIPMESNNFNTGDVEAYIRDTFGKNAVTAQVQQIYSPDAPESQAAQLIIKASKSETFSADDINTLQDHLDAEYGIVDGERVSIRTVEPYIGQEMLGKGLLAIGIASVLILLYVWVRFSVMSGFISAVCATLALVHDALIVFAVYSIFRLPVNDLFIAAILTIIGYSLNDTIIIYDRIRENAKGAKKMSYVELINTSLNQTVIRSLNTVITTMVSIVTVYVFAYIFKIGSLQEFCFPLIIGMVAGSYSTLFIATQVWAMWQMKLENVRLKASRSASKA
jgi:preprotein translocase subunit SecF